MRKHAAALGLLLLLISANSASAPPARNNIALCGIVACPAGLHVASLSCNLVMFGKSCPDQTVCVPDRGPWFTQCGTDSCPLGFQLSSRTCNLAACGGQCPNQTVCTRH